MKDTCFHGIGPDGDCEMCRDIITAIRPSDRSPSPSPDASLLEARSLVARLAAAETRAERAEADARTEAGYVNLLADAIDPLIRATGFVAATASVAEYARGVAAALATVKALTAERDYLRAREAWLRRYAQAEVDDIEQVHEWLAANPEPQPPEGCAP